MGSLHYVGAANGPLLATFQQLQMAGIEDAFATNDRLAKFAEFYMQAMSPPEVRFGGKRQDGGHRRRRHRGHGGVRHAGAPASRRQSRNSPSGSWAPGGKTARSIPASTARRFSRSMTSCRGLAEPRRREVPRLLLVLRIGWGTPDGKCRLVRQRQLLRRSRPQRPGRGHRLPARCARLDRLGLDLLAAGCRRRDA